MASEPQGEPSGRQPIPPATRRRLQQCFEHGSKSASSSNFDYAANMFDMCVKGDPANQLYVRQYLVTLGKKYNDNKKGAGFTSAANVKFAQGVLKKTSYSKDWKGVLEKGWEVLKLNPWDVGTLTAMADACGELHFDEVQLVYLKQALDVNPKDAEVNRKCGRVLAALGQFDQAIACWHRVQQARPGDEEAARAVGDLAVEKTISAGKYEEAESGQDVRADKMSMLSDADNKLTPQQRLEKQISKKPEELPPYLELADLHTREERHKQAIEMLTKALELSGGDIMVRERLEDARLRLARQQVAVAQKKAEKERTPEAIELLKQMKSSLNSAETEVYRSRCERYPTNLRHRFELGLRLKKAGQFQEAIKYFQDATGDPKQKPKAHLEQGECFQSIKQYRLAMQNYETALAGLAEREIDDRKLALYRAGRLALALAEKYVAGGDSQAKDEIKRAEKYLNDLASIEYGYKDVPQLLDKVAKIRDKG